MKVSRPVLLIKLAAVAVCIIADTGNVIGKSIKPYIYYMLIIKIYRNSPLK